jgi:hypothetical protein
VFAAYKRSGFDRAYYDANAGDIILHRAAKKFFDERGFKGNLPSINSLKQEYAVTLAEKKKLYAEYHALRDTSRELAIAKANADRLLGVAGNGRESDARGNGKRRETQER